MLSWIENRIAEIKTPEIEGIEASFISKDGDLYVFSLGYWPEEGGEKNIKLSESEIKFYKAKMAIRDYIVENRLKFSSKDKVGAFYRKTLYELGVI